MAKLTKAQQRLVDELRAGQTLVRSFDVWGGHWWWLRGPTTTKVKRDTVYCLEERGILVVGEDVRIHSGYREATYTLGEREK